MKLISAILLGSSLVFFTAITQAGSQKAPNTPVNYLQHPKAQQFILEMIRKHHFKKKDMYRWFASIKPRPDIIEAISHPAEATKPWYQYRKIFMIEKRIQGGAEFMKNNKADLMRAEKQTGVPAEIIVAILGVETLYNRYKGRHFVLESLATLAFDYPKRSRFFRSELEQFLLLAREESVDPLKLKGSYAGAMGGPQFISSSFRRYAIDFDNDGKRDIWNNTTDMIGSVANYFKVHGWKQGHSIIMNADVQGTIDESLLKKGIKPRYTLKELADKGIVYRINANDKKAANITDSTKAALIKFEMENGPAYRLGLNNFYVITRYNHSPLYAMAVVELSRAIVERGKKLENAKP